MPLITFKQKGDFSKATTYLEKIKRPILLAIVNKYGILGVNALSSMTPLDSGKTAESWSYEIEMGDTRTVLSFHNSNINKGVPIAIILQYGHGTGTGGWVEGRDYINPAIVPIFDGLVNDVWREVTSI